MAQTAIVTGAASGIGAALAAALAARGDRVFALDRVAFEGGGSVEARVCDVTDTDALDTLAGEIWEASGGVDLVFANAGTAAGGPLMKVTPAQFERTFAVNVIGAWATLRVFASRMIAAGRPGRLCVTGSEHSLGFQHAGAGIYTASKHAVLGMAEVLRHEVPETISVSVLCPGLTRTDFAEDPDASEAARAFAREVMSEGMDPAIVARAAIEGTERGDFIIATHAASKAGANQRAREVADAFSKVPAEGADAERYSVPRVVSAVRARFTSGD